MDARIFFREINSSANNSSRQQLATTAAAARTDVQKMSIMYYVNQLNKLARKNEYVENTNIRDLGVMLQKHTGDKDLFTARVFVKDYNGRPCVISGYKGTAVSVADLQHGDVCTDKGKEIRLSANGDGLVVYRPVTMSLPGLVSAYKMYLQPFAAAADKAAAAARKAEKKAEKKAANKAAAAARKAIKEQQKQAITDYQNGKIDINEFARIMSIAA